MQPAADTVDLGSTCQLAPRAEHMYARPTRRLHCATAKDSLYMFFRLRHCLVKMPWLALKALPAGYTATSPWSVKENVKPDASTAMAVSSGVYSYYQVRSSNTLPHYTVLAHNAQAANH